MKLPHKYVFYDWAFRITVTSLQVSAVIMAFGIGRSLLFPKREKAVDSETRKNLEDRIESEQKLREDEFLAKKGMQ